MKVEIVIDGGESITVQGVVAKVMARIVESREDLQTLENRKGRIELNLTPRSVGLKWLVSLDPTEPD